MSRCPCVHPFSQACVQVSTHFLRAGVQVSTIFYGHLWTPGKKTLPPTPGIRASLVVIFGNHFLMTDLSTDRIYHKIYRINREMMIWSGVSVWWWWWCVSVGVVIIFFLGWWWCGGGGDGGGGLGGCLCGCCYYFFCQQIHLASHHGIWQ